jgi:hypothetical protein
MKKIILTLLLSVGINLVINAQGNLQFNQAKLVSTVETVPAGKVWKVESVLYSQVIQQGAINNLATYHDNAQILINGNSLSIRSVRQVDGGSGGKSGFVWEVNYPIWLPSGTTLAAGGGVIYLSVIEFNIQP